MEQRAQQRVVTGAMSGLEPADLRLRNDPTLAYVVMRYKRWRVVLVRFRLPGTDCAQFVQQLLEPEDPFPDPEIGYSARFSAAAAPFTP